MHKGDFWRQLSLGGGGLIRGVTVNTELLISLFVSYVSIFHAHCDIEAYS